MCKLTCTKTFMYYVVIRNWLQLPSNSSTHSSVLHQYVHCWVEFLVITHQNTSCAFSICEVLVVTSVYDGPITQYRSLSMRTTPYPQELKTEGLVGPKTEISIVQHTTAFLGWTLSVRISTLSQEYPQWDLISRLHKRTVYKSHGISTDIYFRRNWYILIYCVMGAGFTPLQAHTLCDKH